MRIFTNVVNCCKRAVAFVKDKAVALAAVGTAAAAAVMGHTRQAVASISSADMTSITDGMQSSTADFYKLGGVLLIILAGIWAFFQVKGLLGKK